MSYWTPPWQPRRPITPKHPPPTTPPQCWPPTPQEKLPWSQRGSAVTVVVPTTGVLPGQNLKSLDNWRAFVHQITPVVVTTLVGIGIVTDSQVTLWVPVIFAVIDPLLSVMNTADKVRRIIYGLAGLFQVGGLATGLVTGLSSGGNGVIAACVGAGITILSTALARFFTPTTTLVPAS